ncbi:hypothetical protein ACT453_01455 [Bacillus sp. D-CC]
MNSPYLFNVEATAFASIRADQYDEQNEKEQFLAYNGHGIFRSYRCKSCCSVSDLIV